jgi:hypothetical protein
VVNFLSFPQNVTPVEPELADLLALFKKEVFLDLNAHAIAKIQAFNPIKQTATASVNYQKTYFVQDNITGKLLPKLQSYPFLADCPVVFAGGAAGAITIPPVVGDDCLVFFNDRDIDKWFNGSTTSAPASSRLHAFADGILLVGLRSLNNVLLNFDMDGITLRTRDGLTKLKIKSDGTQIIATVGPAMEMVLSADGTVSITNGVDELIGSLIKLFQDIQAAYTVTLLGNQPLVMPTFAIDLLKLQSFEA